MSDYQTPPARFAAATDRSVPLYLVDEHTLEACLATLPAPAASWARTVPGATGLGQVTPLPDASGALSAVLLGNGTSEARQRVRFAQARAAAQLPAGTYHLATELPPAAAEEFALGWLLESYRFTRYKDTARPAAQLVAPNGLDATRLEVIAAGEFLTRDLINTPAEDMGPDHLEGAARALASQHGADIAVTSGQALLTANLPLIHTVGRASTSAPRLIDISWGSGPQLTLVGKGVCFDTGGLNLKPGSSMGLMKKDMGGAANVLGLAHMIMALNLPLRLRVLIPAVENAVDGSAFRPGDILTARNGLTVEINNTDAEGRLVLADALALATEENPARIISMATLTGAARVALGPDLAPFYTGNDGSAALIEAAAARSCDPVWRMPFHTPYEPIIEPGIADLDNAPSGGMAGSITAALFLRRFTRGQAYSHFDIYGWCPSAAPGRPKGGVGQGTRALLDALPELLTP